MLTRFLGKKRNQGDSRISQKFIKNSESPFGDKGGIDPKQVNRKTAGDVVLNQADRQMFKYKLPTQERGFGDLLDKYDGEGVFPYAAITSQADESAEARMRRLVNTQPRINSRKLNVPDYISVKLFKEVEEFPLSSIITMSSKQKEKTQYDYILIKRVMFIFTPLSSFFDSHSDVIVSLTDLRKRTGKVARQFNLTDNEQYKVEGSLDYCFPKSSSEKISLSFAQEVATFDSGEQWGACQIFLELEESDYPQVSSFQEVIGMASLTTSVLQDYDFDPTSLNLALRDNHRSALRDLYIGGKITDETDPAQTKTGKVKYARSSGANLREMRDGPRQVKVGEDGFVDWSLLNRNKSNQIPLDQISNDPSADGFAESSQSTAPVPDIQAMVVQQQAQVLKSTLKKKVDFPDLPKQQEENHEDDEPISVGKLASAKIV